MPTTEIAQRIANNFSHKLEELAGIVGHCVLHREHHVLSRMKGGQPFLVMKLRSDVSQSVAQLAKP